MGNTTMLIRATLLFAVVLFVFGVTGTYAQPESFTWKQRTNTGPVVDKSAQRLWYELAPTGLTIWAVIDSTDLSNYLYMKLEVKAFKTKPGTYDLGTATAYQYGARSDMKFKNTGGQAIVTALDENTNVVSLDFNWFGYVKLQNDIELTIRITEGKCNIYIKPELGTVIRPAEGVKVKKKESTKFKVYANRVLAPEKNVAGATITLTHDGTVFEGAKTVTATTNAEGFAQFDLMSHSELVDGDYSLKTTAKKVGFIDSKENVLKFKVDPTGRYYYSKCKGVSFIEFDAGADNTWEDDGAPFILCSGNTTLMAGMIEFPGKTRIDTSNGGAKVYVANGIKIPNTSYDGTTQDLQLGSGAFAFIAPSCDMLVDFAIGELVSKISGGKIKDPKFEILGDGVASLGLKITAGMELGKATYEGCNDDLPFGTVWKPNKTSSAELELSVLKTGSIWNFAGSGTVKNFTPVASWCVKEAKIEYNGAASEFKLSAKIKNPLVSEASGSVTFKDGTLNALALKFELDKCIPIPDIPSVCWRGGGFSVENLFIGNPLKGSVEASFGPYDPLKNIYLLTIKGGFEDPPAKIYGEVTGNLLRVDAVSSSKPWQAEVKGTGTLEPASIKGSLKVDIKLLHLGGDYFYSGSYQAALALKPIGVSGSLEGSLTLPKVGDDLLPKLGTLGRFINKFAPFPLGKASGTISLQEEGERKATISYDFRGLIAPNPDTESLAAALRAMGNGTLSVDFNLLPSPSAWDLDAGFLKLIATLGGIKQTSKGGESVQATERTVSVAGGQTSLIVILEANAAGVTSTLTRPDATIITSPDPTNGIHRVISADGKSTLWVVAAPPVGAWKVTSPNIGPTDTIAILTSVPPPTFELTTAVVGNNLVATWTGMNVPPSTNVRLFVDTDDTGFDGTFVGLAQAGAGTLSVALQDSTIACTFRVYAIVNGPTVGLADYSSDQHSNPRATLPVPTNVTAESNVSGNTTITWAPIDDARIASIGVLDATSDSLITSAYRFDNSVTVNIPSHQTAQLRLVTYDHRGRRSCSSAPLSITTDVDDDAVFAGDHGYAIGVAPNPVYDRARIFVSGAANETVNIRVVDIRGIEVFSTSVAIDGSSASVVEVPASSLAQGAYTIILSSPTASVTRQFLVMR